MPGITAAPLFLIDRLPGRQLLQAGDHHGGVGVGDSAPAIESPFDVVQSMSRTVVGQLGVGESAYGVATTLAAPVEVGASCLDTCRLAALLLAECTVINEPANSPSGTSATSPPSLLLESLSHATPLPLPDTRTALRRTVEGRRFIICMLFINTDTAKPLRAPGTGPQPWSPGRRRRDIRQRTQTMIRRSAGLANQRSRVTSTRHSSRPGCPSS